jgi:hypothetical protein
VIGADAPAFKSRRHGRSSSFAPSKRDVSMRDDRARQIIGSEQLQSDDSSLAMMRD